MSRKTKAELEADNKALRRQVEIQAEQIRDLLDGADWDQYKQKITNKARDATIKEACSLSDTVQVQAHDVKTLADDNLEAQHKLARRGKGPRTKQEKDKEKSDYCTEHFKQLLAEGIPHRKARTKANKATAEKFGKGLKKSALYVHCPVPSADK